MKQHKLDYVFKGLPFKFWFPIKTFDINQVQNRGIKGIFRSENMLHDIKIIGIVIIYLSLEYKTRSES